MESEPLRLGTRLLSDVVDLKNRQGFDYSALRHFSSNLFFQKIFYFIITMNIQNLSEKIIYQELLSQRESLANAYNLFYDLKLNNIQKPFYELVRRRKEIESDLIFILPEVPEQAVDDPYYKSFYPGIKEQSTLFLFGVIKFKDRIWFSYYDIDNLLIIHTLDEDNEKFKKSYLIETSHPILENDLKYNKIKGRVQGFNFSMQSFWPHYCLSKNNLKKFDFDGIQREKKI